ncbi:hypothetical protein ACJ77P_10510 [Syntrophus buswellii]|mgnify:FL=1|uniref:hypothetical protein n=1 Tax=Syntrophus buswellii TaxID=43774 RepID=UPI0038D39C17
MMSKKSDRRDALRDEAVKIAMQYALSEDHSVGKIDEVLESVYRTLVKLQDEEKAKNQSTGLDTNQ